jgi:hypothetical protein
MQTINDNANGMELPGNGRQIHGGSQISFTHTAEQGTLHSQVLRCGQQISPFSHVGYTSGCYHFAKHSRAIGDYAGIDAPGDITGPGG